MYKLPNKLYRYLLHIKYPKDCLNSISLRINPNSIIFYVKCQTTIKLYRYNYFSIIYSMQNYLFIFKTGKIMQDN